MHNMIYAFKKWQNDLNAFLIKGSYSQIDTNPNNPEFAFYVSHE